MTSRSVPIAPPPLKRWATLALILVAPVLFLLPATTTLFQFDRAAITQPWRILTCHFTHWSPEHLLYSGGAFALLAFLCHRASPRRFITCTIVSATSISAAVACLTDLRFYRGLSGIDAALFTLLALQLLRQNISAGRPLAIAATAACFLALAAKIAYEAATGQAVFVAGGDSHMVPVPLAHAVGAVAGLVIGLKREFQLPNRSELTKMSPRGGPCPHAYWSSKTKRNSPS